ncbi:hypothetical protein [Cerasicoccus fimbriatus]|uniref:hypothetical protein n=1 Tax=Cerasicoccus fimbriatus TaxID=3014554 RepID=UPI0022B4BEE8|nr:hypothetical protein [Cerasicoccus sp. TK19100]
MPKRKTIDFRKVERWLMIFAVVMIVPFIVLALFYPVKAIPLYGKQVGMGLFALMFYFSLRYERRREKERRERREHTPIANKDGARS